MRFVRAVGWGLVWGSGMMAVVAGSLEFRAASDGGYEFDTGELRGRLRRGGQSVGLQEVVHVPTGVRLDHSQGLLSHYRVFTKGRRYGGGAWDWGSRARVTVGGGVEVVWEAEAERPFELRAEYTWKDARMVELRTEVRAKARLTAFETFVASYFGQGFTNARVAKAGGGGWHRAERASGEWQMFPREVGVVSMIGDGRWGMAPNPVEWTVREALGGVLVVERRAVRAGIRVRLEAPGDGCFAAALPEEMEGHRSVYFSLFGVGMEPGEVREGRVRLSLSVEEPVGETVGGP